MLPSPKFNSPSRARVGIRAPEFARFFCRPNTRDVTGQRLIGARRDIAPASRALRKLAKHLTRHLNT
eukprot:1576802-Pyramimonas_sp.AAC.1